MYSLNDNDNSDPRGVQFSSLTLDYSISWLISWVLTFILYVYTLTKIYFSVSLNF